MENTFNFWNNNILNIHSKVDAAIDTVTRNVKLYTTFFHSTTFNQKSTIVSLEYKYSSLSVNYFCGKTELYVSRDFSNIYTDILPINTWIEKIELLLSSSK